MEGRPKKGDSPRAHPFAQCTPLPPAHSWHVPGSFPVQMLVPPCVVLAKRNPASCVVSVISLFCHITVESLKCRGICISKPQGRVWPLILDTHPFFLHVFFHSPGFSEILSEQLLFMETQFELFLKAF
ncbi:unnamed protein product [Rangifer tarandus platyrhynchus]|uniref:Uncharacterized protein n=2 Tax=Rangifer tarandus platyrhynchus TaxID=3082113 RepID=A0AC59ZFT1_RANTA|nr:unnamed protein product [Rangifer tarandus platyrhynchus]